MNYNNNLDPKKYISCAGCSKPAELRWKWGHNNPITPYKGLNGEELCHKCAFCIKCGKNAPNSYEERFYRYEKTNDNPSGEWVLAYCSKECFDGKKPSLPKKELKQTIKCDNCGKLREIKFGNSESGKYFCSETCWDASLLCEKFREVKRRCRICSLQIFDQVGNFAKDFKNREVYYSDSNINAFYCSEICFEKREDKSGVNCCYYDPDNSPKSTNSPAEGKPNPAAPSPQPITNSDHLSDNSVKTNPDNSPKPGTDQTLEIKISPQPVDNPKNKPKKDNHQTLTINLKDIKKISLVGNNLMIEFNQNSPSQVVVSEQVRDNPVLSKVKSYLQSAQHSTLSQQELASILSQGNTDHPVADPSVQTSPNPFFWTAVGIIGITVIVGLLLLVAKIRKPRSAKQK